MPHIVETLEHVAVPGRPDEPLPMFQRMLRKLYEQLARVVNGGISFGDSENNLSDNIAGAWVGGQFTVPDDDKVFIHNLGHIPNGWIVAFQDAAGSIYWSDFTTTTLTLKCSTAPVIVRLFIF